MTRKLTKIFKWLLILCLIVPILGAAAVVGWAITGPRDLKQYVPYIESSIASLMPKHKVEIGGASLAWAGFQEMLQVETSDVKVFDETGALLAVFPKIDLDFDIPNLLVGNLVPHKLRLVNPELDLSILKLGERNNDEIKFDSLSKLEIVNARMILPNDVNVWVVPSAKFSLSGHNAKFEATAGIDGKDPMNLAGKLQINGKNIAVQANILAINTRDIESFIPELKNVNLSLGASADIKIEDYKISQIKFAAQNIKGETLQGDIFRAKSGVVLAAVSGSYDAAAKKLEIENFTSQFNDGAKLAAKGVFYDAQNMRFNISGENVLIESLIRYWPQGLGENAIKWTDEHLKNGRAIKGAAAIVLKPEYFLGGDRLAPEAIDVDVDFEKMDMDYQKPFLPVLGAKGTAHMDGDSIEFNVTEANVGKSQAKDISVEITGIGGEEAERIEIKGSVKGAAADIVDFYEKAGSGKKMFKSNDVYSGVAETKASLKFPLLAALKLDEVNYDIQTKVTNAQVANFLGDLATSKLNLEADLKTNSYKASGSFIGSTNSELLTLQDIPIAFSVEQSGKDSKYKVAANLLNSFFEIKQLGIRKDKGKPAQASIYITQKNGVATIDQFDLASDALRVSASGNLNADMTDIALLKFNKLEFGESRLAGKLTKNPYYFIDLAGNYLDASHIVESARAKQEAEPSGPNFSAKIAVSNLKLKGDEVLSNTRVAVVCPQSDCTKLRLQANDIFVDMGDGKLSVNTSNAGKLLRGIGSYENMYGGDLTISATKINGTYQGFITGKELRLKKAGTLTKILTLGSLAGIADAMSGEGIRFAKLAGEFSYKKGRIEVQKFRMFGPAIGITAEGFIERNKDQVKIDGSIIPAYTANTLLGKIPLLGDIIIGDKGVFAFAYSVRGKFSDPEVSVNPLSVLAPGFLKEIFN